MQPIISREGFLLCLLLMTFGLLQGWYSSSEFFVGLGALGALSCLCAFTTKN